MYCEPRMQDAANNEPVPISPLPDQTAMDSANLLLEVESLSWRLLDNELSHTELNRFESLLLASSRAMQTYIDCVQMHIGLRELVAGPLDLLAKCDLRRADSL